MLPSSVVNARPSFYPAIQGDLPTVVRGEGIYLYDDTGRRFIDAAGGVGCVTAIGHGVAEVADAVAEQLRTLAFTPWTQFQTPPVADLAERVAEVTPGDLNHVVQFTSGSEVTEAAVKLARQYWQAVSRAEKSLVISRWQGFHGMTLGASGFSGHTGRRRNFVPMIHDMPKIPPAYAYRCVDCATGSLRCADELERTIRWHGPENVACFIAEPVVGATMGGVPAPAGYFQRIREICDRYDVLFIADEVMTGFGRTGRWFAVEHWDLVPDILVAGKGVSGGYAPLSVLAASDRIVQALREQGTALGAGHTYAQNPVCAAAGVAVRDYLHRHDLVRAAEERGAELARGLTRLKERRAVLGDVRGKGLLLGVELVRDQDSKEPFPVETGVAFAFARACIAAGAAVYPGQGGADGLLGDHALVTPPLTITSDQVQELLDAIDHGLAAVESNGS
jgi:adenosylmethionine-8-amino-7-oxononanoate aminotransferase